MQPLGKDTPRSKPFLETSKGLPSLQPFIHHLPPSLPFWLPPYLLLLDVPTAQPCLLLYLPHYVTTVPARPFFYAIFDSAAEHHQWRSWPTRTKALTDVRMEGLASAQTKGGVQTDVLFITSAKEDNIKKKAPACIVMACMVVGEEGQAAEAADSSG